MKGLGNIVASWYARVGLAGIGVALGTVGVLAGTWFGFDLHLLWGLYVVVSCGILSWAVRPYRISSTQVWSTAWHQLVFASGILATGIVMGILLVRLPWIAPLGIALESVMMLAALDAMGWDNPVPLWYRHLVHVSIQGARGWAVIALSVLLGVLLARYFPVLVSSVALAGVPLIALWYVISWHKAPFNAVG